MDLWLFYFRHAQICLVIVESSDAGSCGSILLTILHPDYVSHDSTPILLEILIPAADDCTLAFY